MARRTARCSSSRVTAANRVSRMDFKSRAAALVVSSGMWLVAIVTSPPRPAKNALAGGPGPSAPAGPASRSLPATAPASSSPRPTPPRPAWPGGTQRHPGAHGRGEIPLEHHRAAENSERQDQHQHQPDQTDNQKGNAHDRVGQRENVSHDVT